MMSSPTFGEVDAEHKPPFLYEIQVKARLSPQQWTDWFDDLSVEESAAGSVLRGRAEDHAALYGILARLRDLAVPLVSVKVLDAEAQRRLAETGRRLDLIMTALLVGLYLLLLGGLVGVAIEVAPAISTALALTLLFAALGGLAYGFAAWSGRFVWRWLAYFLALATGVTFLVYIPVSGILPPALGIGVTLLLLAGGVIYLLSFLRRLRDDLSSREPGTRSGQE